MTINDACILYRDQLFEINGGLTDGFGRPVPGRITGGYASHIARLSNKIRSIPMRKLAANPALMANEIAAIRKRLGKGSKRGRHAAISSVRVVDGMFRFLRKLDPSLVDDPVSAVHGALQRRPPLKIYPTPRHSGYSPRTRESGAKLKTCENRGPKCTESQFC